MESRKFSLLIFVIGFSAITVRAEDPVATREAVCRKVDQAPVIDGKLEDAAWRGSEGDSITHFPAFWAGKESGKGTRAQLAWDDEGLYFAATMTDSEMRSFGTKRNDMLWNGDVFELFFKPSTTGPRYYELQVNPRSVILELPFPARGHDFEALAALPPGGFKAVAVVDGTLDHPGDKDLGWRVEGKVPWSFFEATGGRPKVGDTWTFALCRYDYGPEGTEPTLMSSAPLTKMNFHLYEDYGRLTFVGRR